MVRPVQEAGVSSVNVLFPGHNELWYDLRSYQAYKPGSIEMPVDISTVSPFLPFFISHLLYQPHSLGL